MTLELEFITGKDTNGEDIIEKKLFVTTNIKARIVRKALELKKEVSLGAESESLETLDKLVDFTCEVYKNKFTRDELYDGLDANLLFKTLVSTMEGAAGGVSDKLDTFPTIK